ncbi:MAG: hypothetical protein ABJM82_16170 [Shimia thalassica]|uniref:hypothetical protein n=1 Tax=Shimia thalassica TaxID=1715693 RepID=UPI00329946D4
MLLQFLDDGDFGRIRRSIYIFASLQLFISGKNLHLTIPFVFTDLEKKIPATLSSDTVSFTFTLILVYLLAHFVALIPSEIEKFRHDKKEYNDSINSQIEEIKGTMDKLSSQAGEFEKAFDNALEKYMPLANNHREFTRLYYELKQEEAEEATKNGKRLDPDALAIIKQDLIDPMSGTHMDNMRHLFFGIKTELSAVSETAPDVTTYLKGLKDANSLSYKLVFHGQFFSKLILNIGVPAIAGTVSLIDSVHSFFN